MFTNIHYFIQGDHIMATLGGNQRKQYLQQLKESHTYLISNVKVIKAQDDYRVVTGEYGICFFHRTKIEQLPDCPKVGNVKHLMANNFS